jgi:hypothetical protein
MAGLDPAIHVFAAKKAWMPGTRPGMTNKAHVPELRANVRALCRLDRFDKFARLRGI